jgi:hypothetical protein
MRRALLLIFLIPSCCFALLAQSQRMIDHATIANDNSDWWSLTRMDDSEPNIEPQKRVPIASNFTILGVALGDAQGVQLAAKLGKAAIVARGDAGSARAQVCYASAAGSPAVHLIFEQGELDYAFYLFSDGPGWHGSDLCRKSPLISSHLTTGSGLALSQTPSQVEAILGKPTAVRNDRWIYSGEVLVEPALQGKTGNSYTLDTEIQARFSNGRLTYLAVVKTESD